MGTKTYTYRLTSSHIDTGDEGIEETGTISVRDDENLPLAILRRIFGEDLVEWSGDEDFEQFFETASGVQDRSDGYSFSANEWDYVLEVE